VSVRDKLVLLFFAITAAAIAFVYLYVVPQLRTSLTAEKLGRQEAAAASASSRLAEAQAKGASQAELRRLVRNVAQESAARVTLLGVRRGETGPESVFVIADSELENTAVVPRYPPAATAASRGELASAIEDVGGQRLAETAIGVPAEAGALWVGVLSSPLADVDDNVALIQRQILIAGLIALLLAALAGSLAARGLGRRLRRLEGAAEAVAEGNFDVQIPIDSSDEVGQLARALHEMQLRLARLDSARKEFIANASHELRTPIFSLGGFVELLETDDPDPESRREFVHTMRGQIDRLTKLATDLLDLSKLDADAIEVSAEDVDLDRLASEIAGEFRATAEQHSSSLTVAPALSGPAIALADPDRVGQIMRILLDNALTHTPEGTSITVSTNRQDGRAALVVSDDGPGIEPASRSRVFERFYTGTETRGSGLGLAIANELSHLMGGQLEVRSGGGHTDFELALPTP
jgi:signal transduction histidine kinase